MIQLFELTVDQATIIAFVLPIVAVCLFFLIIPSLRKGSSSKLRRYLSFLITPPRIGSLESQGDSVENRSATLWRGVKVRLYFVYLAIALFLISFMISEFYQVMIDLSIPVTQGSTGEIRSVTSVVFMSPFEAGWFGALPWYGQLPAPTSFGTYHTTWSWIFMTASYTDNPYFLESMVVVLLLVSIIVGLVFLSPLASKTIRRSFLPSMFFFLTSMMVFAKTAVGCTAQVIALVLGSQIQYGIAIATGDLIPNLIQGVVFGLPIILAMFLLFAALGWKLWKVHYQDSVSRRWFMFYVTLSFWVGLAIPIVIA